MTLAALVIFELLAVTAELVATAAIAALELPIATATLEALELLVVFAVLAPIIAVMTAPAPLAAPSVACQYAKLQ